MIDTTPTIANPTGTPTIAPVCAPLRNGPGWTTSYSDSSAPDGPAASRLSEKVDCALPFPLLGTLSFLRDCVLLRRTFLLT